MVYFYLPGNLGETFFIYLIVYFFLYLLDYVTKFSDRRSQKEKEKKKDAEICHDVPLFSKLGKTFTSNHFLINYQILMFK